MPELMQDFLSQPWYLIVLAVIGFLYVNHKGFIKSFKDGMDSVNKNDVSYRYAKTTKLTEEQQQAIALDAVMTAYWEVDNNTLAFTHNGKKPPNFDKYMEGWFITTAEGYKDLRDYFLADGRRGYFNFIYPLHKNAPKEQWSARMMEEYSNNERPYKMLTRLSEYDVAQVLIKEGVIDSADDMKIGVLGWDVSVLIGQARRAYTAGLVSEEEALATIQQAKALAVQNFSSWQEFGRSQVIGMALDYYHHDDTFFADFIETYNQVKTDEKSPWNTIPWLG